MNQPLTRRPAISNRDYDLKVGTFTSQGSIKGLHEKTKELKGGISISKEKILFPNIFLVCQHLE